MVVLIFFQLVCWWWKKGQVISILVSLNGSWFPLHCFRSLWISGPFPHTSTELRLLPAPPHGSQLSCGLKIPRSRRPPLELMILTLKPQVKHCQRPIPQTVQLHGYRQAEVCEQHRGSKGTGTWRLRFPHPPLPACSAFCCWQMLLVHKTLVG